MNQITVPFTPDQVNALNQYQVGVHGGLPSPSFTCPNRSDAGPGGQAHGQEGGDLGVLVATPAGWICPHCDYTQDWAHAFMAESHGIGGESKMSNSLMAEMMRQRGLDPQAELHASLDQAIGKYLNFWHSRRISVKQTAEENASSQRIWTACAVMLASLRMRRLAVMGIVARPGHAPKVDATWHDLNASKPADHVAVHLLMHDMVHNPGHDGFGCDAWIETRSFNSGRILLTGGMPTHWREIAPASPGGALRAL